MTMPERQFQAKSDDEGEVFYASAAPLSALLSSVAGIGLLAFLMLTEGSDILLGGVVIAGVFIVYLTTRWARRIVSFHPVHVTANGVRVYGLRGGPTVDNHWLEWSAISRVTRFHIPFNPCLVLRSQLGERYYWIPEKLVNGERFRERVHIYAGRAHPLTQVLYS